MLLLHPVNDRGVAQLASVLAWGASGRQFESDHSDKMKYRGLRGDV